MKLTAIQDHILVTEMNFGERTTSSGIVLRSDNGTSEGVRPRWAKIYAVGPLQTLVSVGQWILVEHGRWTRGVEISETDDENKIELFRIDPNGILVVSDDEPADDMFGEFATQTRPGLSDFII